MRRSTATGWTRGLVFLFGCVPAAHASDSYDDEQEEQRPTEWSSSRSEDDQEEGLSAGGLKAPESLPEKGDDRSEIEKALDEADQKDSGRGLEFVWLTGDVGYGLFGLSTIVEDNLLSSEEKRTALGPVIGAGAGVRLLYLTLGGRFRYGFLSNYNLFSALFELGLKIPLGSLEPYGNLGVGYVGVTGLERENGDQNVPSLHGVGLRASGGLDYYLSDSFSVGAQLSGDLFFLRRRAISGSDACPGTEPCIYSDSGKSVGAGLMLGLSLGLHF